MAVCQFLNFVVKLDFHASLLILLFKTSLGTPGWLWRLSVQLLISAQVMVLGLRDVALCRLCAGPGACLRFSLSFCPPPPRPLALLFNLKLLLGAPEWLSQLSV